MAEESLTGQSIKNSYEGLLHLNDGGLSTGSGSGARKRVYDGVGKSTCLDIAKDYCRVNGDLVMDSPTNAAYVYINTDAAAIELADDGSTDNPYIDFKTTGSEDYDCRIIKASNGLEFSTGGNGNTNKIVTMKSTGLLAVQGGLSVRPTIKSQCLVDFTVGTYNPGGTGRSYVGAITPTAGISTDLGGLFVGCDDNNGDENALLLWNHTGADIQGGQGRAGEIFKVQSDGDTTVGRKLFVKDGLQLKTSGTEAAGKVLTCTNSSGDTEWAPGVASVHFDAVVKAIRGCTLARNSAGNYTVTVPNSGKRPTAVASFAHNIGLGGTGREQFTNANTISARTISNTQIIIEIVELYATSDFSDGDDDYEVAVFNKRNIDVPFQVIVSN